MIIISGQTYSTIVDAARELDVSAKTIRQYIAKKIIPEPPVIQFGNRKVKHFSQNYLTAAKKQLQKYRTGRDRKG
jgi:DNA-binding transcriptional MerR regulator